MAEEVDWKTMEQFQERIDWASYFPGPPRAGEVLVFFLAVVGLICAGVLLKRYWARNNESVPFPVALMLWLGMFAVYLMIVFALYENAADIRRTTVISWGIVFWVIPATYYTFTVVNSLAMRSVDHIGPFSAIVEDPSEFAAARKLALRGDIDGAISMYRNYPDNQVNALFEAARLLKSEDRYMEAAMILEEIRERFRSQIRAWAEATYQLAKIEEHNLNDHPKAIMLLQELIYRAPESRFAHLASADIARLQMTESTQQIEQRSVDTSEPADPFYRYSDIRTHFVPETALKTETEDADSELLPIPPVDPFVAMRQEAAATPSAQRARSNAAETKSDTTRKTPKGAPKTKRTAAKRKASHRKRPAK